MSLVETLMGMAALGGVLMVVLSLNEIQTKNITTNRVIASRDTLKGLAERYVSEPDNIKKSYIYRGANDAGNKALQSCLEPVAAECPTSNCCVDNSNAPADFYFWDPSYPKFDPARPNEKHFFAGLDSNPMRYNTDGLACAVASGGCPVEMVTRFTATCAGGPGTSCEIPTSLKIEYIIRQAAAAVGKNTALKTIQMSISIPISRFKIGGGLGINEIGSGPSGGAGSGAVIPSVMYLRSTKDSTNQTPASCPSDWQPVDLQQEASSHFVNWVRTCVRADKSCEVLYIRKLDDGTGDPASCPTGWVPADLKNESAGDFTNKVRTCYVCP